MDQAEFGASAQANFYGEDLPGGVTPQAPIRTIDLADMPFDSSDYSGSSEHEDVEMAGTSSVKVTEEDLELEEGIREAIAYTRSQLAAKEPPRQFLHYSVAITSPPSTGLTLLRAASTEGVATLICISRDQETYSLGVPRVRQADYGVDSQWWVGKSRAEIRAGPMATDAELKTARREVDAQTQRRAISETRKNGQMRREKETIGEGLRRQQLGLPMSGTLDRETVRLATALWEETMAAEEAEEDRDDISNPSDDSGEEDRVSDEDWTG